MPPSGQPVTWQILDALRTLLQGVDAGATYYNSIRQVALYEMDRLRATQTPLAAVIPDGSSYDDEGHQNVGEVSDAMRITLLLVQHQNNDAAQDLLQLERDVKTALLADYTLSGLVLNIELLGADHTFPDERDYLAYTELRILVRYRTPRTDLNTST